MHGNERDHARSGGRRPGLLALWTLALGLAAAAALSPPQHIVAQTTEPRVGEGGQGVAPTAVPPRTGPVADAGRLGEAFATVAESVSPAVVSIRVEAVRAQPQPFGHGAPFGPFGLGVPNDGEPNVVRGGGSGVIIRPDGYVLTNNHVIAGARRLDVVLRDGRSFPGTVVGRDAATDLAVVKIEARELPTTRFASSDDARVGEWVVAIGSPFGLDYTVTTGVLSAKGRGGLGANEIEDYLQTDASINPGNSGGPLVNLRGEVLGINTMIIGRGAGIGFAVPSDMARSVSRQIIDDGVVRRAWLGVGFQELTPELASHFGTTHRAGALVSNVVPDGPAARAGIRTGDVVLSIAGQEVREGRDLLRQVLRRGVGERVPVEILRRGSRQALTVHLTERPGSEAGDAPSARPVATPRRDRDDLGMQLAPLTAQMKQQLRYAGSGKVVVTGVSSGSAAERAGLTRGDVIVEADREEVREVGQIAGALRDGTALLRVERGQGAFYTVLRRDG